MIKTLLISALVITAGLFASCNNPADNTATSSQHDQLDKASWLVGGWKNSTPEGVLFEMWARESDTTYAGKSCVVKGTDTLFQEEIKLQQRGKDLFYIPTVHDQNGGQPVPFKLTSATNDELVFENPAHDFPQKITYTKITNDSLLAVVSGNVEGEHHSERFPMGRVK